ncbi:MAG: response regulator transcription factor [Cyclobacteriaceae bacterium]
MKAINILIADDHKMFREGLTELLSKEPGMQVMDTAGDGEEIRLSLTTNHIDVILMDIDMGETNGIEMTREIKESHPDIHVLALSMHGDKNYIVKMLEAGANGYILKNAGKEEMINAIHTVANGNTYFSSQVSSKLLEHLTNPAPTRRGGEDALLTDREIEILRLIAEEYSNPEIAEKLFISVRTVDTHRRNILDKLGAKNTAGLVKYAIQKGLLD